MRSLLLGGGRDHRKRIFQKGASSEWSGELTVLDMDPNCGANVVWDLEYRPLPFEDNSFDEMGAYDVLEHVGRQGDWRGWFEEMAEYHRILKPGGIFGILVPIGEDALADPGHTRFFQANWFGFCSRKFYDVNTERRAAFTDYRWYLNSVHPQLNFDVIDINQSSGHHLAVILRAVKE